MSNASTSAERRYQVASMEAMAKAHFSGSRRQEWLIWGSIKRHCPSCSVGPGIRCLNLAKLKRNEHVGIKWPHEDRVDWPKIWEGLKKRGYIE